MILNAHNKSSKMLSFQRVTDETEFACMEGVWNALLVRSAANNPFLTHQWLFCWWKSFVSNASLCILLCFEQTRYEKKLIGIFPGYIKNDGMFYLARLLRLLGSEIVTSDFLDVIVEQGREKEVLHAFLIELKKSNDIHLIELTDLREESALLTLLDTNDKHGWQPVEWQVVKLCPVIRFPATFAEYFAGLSYNVRDKFKRSFKNKLQPKGALLELVSELQDLPQAIIDFARLHNARRTQKDQSDIFATAAQRTFYNEVFERFFQAGWLELAFINVAGERVAGVCQFNYNNSIYYYQTGYDLAWEKSSVGFVLIMLLIERAANQGMSTYEFLRGEEEYKYRLGAAGNRNLKDIYLKNGAVLGEVYLASRFVNRRCRAIAKALIRKKVAH